MRNNTLLISDVAKGGGVTGTKPQSGKMKIYNKKKK